MAVELIQQKVFQALAGFAGLNDLIGARVYPDEAPQQVSKPYITWQEISLVQPADFAGTAESSSVDNYRIQVTSWAADPKGATLARQVDAQVRAAMNAAAGFKSITIDSRAMPYEPDAKLYGRQTDFSVWLKT